LPSAPPRAAFSPGAAAADQRPLTHPLADGQSAAFKPRCRVPVLPAPLGRYIERVDRAPGSQSGITAIMENRVSS
jgi:hypothetical protein